MPAFEEEFRIGKVMRTVPSRDRREVVKAVSEGRRVDDPRLASVAVEYARFVQRSYIRRRGWPVVTRFLWRTVHISGRRGGLEGSESAAQRSEELNLPLT